MFDRTPFDVAQEMAAELAKSPNHAFLVLEGSGDQKFWRPRIRDVGWKCIVARGKKNVLGALGLPGKRPALGIVDADYDHLDQVGCPEHVCRTDEHDLEAMILRSEALSKVVHTLGSSDKIDAFEAASGPVRDRLVALGDELATFRRVNHELGWKLAFKKNQGESRVDYPKFIDKGTWTLNREQMVSTVLNYNSRHDLREAEVLARLAARVPPANRWHWLNGHDLCAILAIGLSKAIGSTNRSLPEVESHLVAAMDRADLEITGLCRAIRAWEANAQRPLLGF